MESGTQIWDRRAARPKRWPLGHATSSFSTVLTVAQQKCHVNFNFLMGIWICTRQSWSSRALTICKEILVENFRQMVLVFFWAPKTGTGLSCTIYKIPVKFLVSLDMKPGTSNPNKWYRKFCFGKNGKKVIPRKVLPFFRKISNGMNRSIWILPGISGFSIQMVSAPRFLTIIGPHVSGITNKSQWILRL